MLRAIRQNVRAATAALIAITSSNPATPPVFLRRWSINTIVLCGFIAPRAVSRRCRGAGRLNSDRSPSITSSPTQQFIADSAGFIAGNWLISGSNQFTTIDEISFVIAIIGNALVLMTFSSA